MNVIDLYKLRDMEYRNQYIDHILNSNKHDIKDFTFLNYLYKLYDTINCEDYDLRSYIFYGISVLYVTKLFKSPILRDTTFIVSHKTNFEELVSKEKSNTKNPFINFFVGFTYFQYYDINKAIVMCKNGLDEIYNCKDIKDPAKFVSDSLYGCNLFKKTVIFEELFKSDDIKLDITIDSDIKIHTNKLNKNELFLVNFTCDPIYFLTLSSNTIKYILQRQGIEKFGCFFHIIYTKVQFENKDLLNDIETKINEIIRNVEEKKSSIIITYEIACVKRDKSLYTSNRFLNMKNFLKITNKDIIQMDIDMSDMCEFDIIDFYNKINLTDISLFKNDGVPWEKICACCSYFKNNNYSYAFSEYYKKIFKIIYNPSRQCNWFIDQYCLFLTYLFTLSYFDANFNVGVLWPFLSKTPGMFNGFYKDDLIKATREKYKHILI